MPSAPSAAPTSLGIQELLGLLPHRYPMLMVDRVDQLEPGVFAEGVKCVTVNEPFFQGHFPEHPIMPGVLIVEAMAQVAGVMLRTRPRVAEVPERQTSSAPARPGLMANIQRMRFRRPVLPGDQLRIRATHLKSLGGLHHVKVEARVGDELAADGELMLGGG